MLSFKEFSVKCTLTNASKSKTKRTRSFQITSNPMWDSYVRSHVFNKIRDNCFKSKERKSLSFIEKSISFWLRRMSITNSFVQLLYKEFWGAFSRKRIYSEDRIQQDDRLCASYCLNVTKVVGFKGGVLNLDQDKF